MIINIIITDNFMHSQEQINKHRFCVTNFKTGFTGTLKQLNDLERSITLNIKNVKRFDEDLMIEAYMIKK